MHVLHRSRLVGPRSYYCTRWYQSLTQDDTSSWHKMPWYQSLTQDGTDNDIRWYQFLTQMVTVPATRWYQSLPQDGTLAQDGTAPIIKENIPSFRGAKHWMMTHLCGGERILHKREEERHLLNSSRKLDICLHYGCQANQNKKGDLMETSSMLAVWCTRKGSLKSVGGGVCRGLVWWVFHIINPLKPSY